MGSLRFSLRLRLDEDQLLVALAGQIEVITEPEVFGNVTAVDRGRGLTLVGLTAAHSRGRSLPSQPRRVLRRKWEPRMHVREVDVPVRERAQHPVRTMTGLAGSDPAIELIAARERDRQRTVARETDVGDREIDAAGVGIHRIAEEVLVERFDFPGGADLLAVVARIGAHVRIDLGNGARRQKQQYGQQEGLPKRKTSAFRSVHEISLARSRTVASEGDVLMKKAPS